MRIIHAVLDRVQALKIVALLIFQIPVRSATLPGSASVKVPNSATRNATSGQGAPVCSWIRRLRVILSSLRMWAARRGNSSRRGHSLITVTAVLSCQECERPAGVDRGCCHGGALEAQLPRSIRNSPHRIFTVYITRAPPRFAGNETIKMHVMETLRKLWCVRLLSIRRSPQADVGSCFADAHVDLEHDKAKFYVREPQFSTPKDSLRDPAFAYWGDIIVGDLGIKFSTLKRLQSSRYTVRWFGHSELEDLLPSAERNDGTGPSSYERIHRSRGIFEKDGAKSVLPKPVSYILSESVWSRSDPKVQVSPHLC